MTSGRPSSEDYLRRWTDLHGGYDPRGNALVRWWLSGVYVVARPLAAARVPPDLITVAGVVVSAAAVGFAWAGSGWIVASAALVVLSGLLDGIDGAVAVLAARTSRWGYVLDSVADRVSDVLYLVALAVLGAPGWLCAVGGALMFLQEYVRARAGAAGMTEVAVLTVWERPTRVIVTATFLLAAAVVGDPWPSLGAWAWAALGLVGCVHLLVVVRRRLG